MATRSAQTTPQQPAPGPAGVPRGLGSWLLTRDHRRLAWCYLLTVLALFSGGALLATVARLEALTPEADLFAPGTLSGMLTLHGLIMVFAVLLPAIPAILGTALVPTLVGARGLAFPRLALLSFYIYLAGAILAITAAAAGGLQTGWSLSGEPGAAALSTLTGVLLLGLSGALNGFNLLVTIHRLRAPDVPLERISCLPCTIYLASVVQIVAWPVLLLLVALVAVQRGFGVVLFDVARGADPALFAQLFWAYAHPTIYSALLPAIGVLGELIAHGTGRPLLGGSALLHTGVALALLSLLGWGQHLMLGGQSELAAAASSAAALGLAVPLAVVLFSAFEALRRGRFALTPSLLYATAALTLLVVGALSGVLLAALVPGAHLHGTCFVPGHAHFMMVGGVVLSFLGGVHHWWPELSGGRRLNAYWGRIGAAVLFGGVTLTFFALLVLGSHGLLRRAAAYGPGFSAELLSTMKTWQGVSTVGSQILVLGFGVVVGCLVVSLLRRREEQTPGPPGTPEAPAPPPLRWRRLLLALVVGSIGYLGLLGYGVLSVDRGHRDTLLQEPAAARATAKPGAGSRFVVLRKDAAATQPRARPTEGR